MSQSEFILNDDELDSSPLNTVMNILGVTALELSKQCAVSNSIISRYKKGTRRLKAGSQASLELARVLSQLDQAQQLDYLFVNQRIGGESKEEALRKFLTDYKAPVKRTRSIPPPIQQTGRYHFTTEVYLGKQGVMDATIDMLEYVNFLPPGQEIVICVHGEFDSIWHNNLPFALRLLLKMKKATERGTTFTLVNRKTDDLEGSPYFSMFWISIQLKGILKTAYYDGTVTSRLFDAVIPGYWQAYVESDNTADDGLITIHSTDSRSIYNAQVTCNAFFDRCIHLDQFGFLSSFCTADTEAKYSFPSVLPPWAEADAPSPDGSFSSCSSIPSFGILTRKEWEALCAPNPLPDLPDYLFSHPEQENNLAKGTCQIILCREDVRTGLSGKKVVSLPLSLLLGREVVIPYDMFHTMMWRIESYMRVNPNFQVALVPRRAFEKLEFEMIHWHHSIALGWLMDGSNSMLTTDPIMSRSFFSGAKYTWNRLRPGWKRFRNVHSTLRKWLTGKDLDTPFDDSAVIRNWELIPKDIKE